MIEESYGDTGRDPREALRVLRNRTDAAAMSIMSERALNNSNTLWGSFTAIASRVTLSMLRDLQEDLGIKCANIKTDLASS